MFIKFYIIIQNYIQQSTNHTLLHCTTLYNLQVQLTNLYNVLYNFASYVAFALCYMLRMLHFIS